MNTSTGQLYSKEQVEDLDELIKENFKEEGFIDNNFKMVEHATPEQLKNMKVGRNEQCPCGSGKWFKRCCLNKKLK